MSKFNPRCVSPGIAPAYCSTGHILPCCYIDGEMEKDALLETLFADHLKIENNDDIKDIYTSDEWVNFFDVLINNPKKVPNKCKAFCGRKNMNNTNAMTNNRYTLTGTFYGKGIDLRNDS